MASKRNIYPPSNIIITAFLNKIIDNNYDEPKNYLATIKHSVKRSIYIIIHPISHCKRCCNN